MAEVLVLGTLAQRLAAPDFTVEGETLSPGRSLTGGTQALFRENRRWVGRLSFTATPLADRLAAQAIGARLRGRFGSLRVPLRNRGTPLATGTDAAFWAEIGIAAGDITAGFTKFGDTTTFSDGTGFALPDTTAATVYAAAPVGASAITLTGAEAAALVPGALFSIDDWLHRVETNTSGRLTFSPPLRAAVSAGAAVELRAPTVRVRLAADDGWRVEAPYQLQGAPFEVEVEEDFRR